MIRQGPEAISSRYTFINQVIIIQQRAALPGYVGLLLLTVMYLSSGVASIQRLRFEKAQQSEQMSKKVCEHSPACCRDKAHGDWGQERSPESFDHFTLCVFTQNFT